MPLIHLHASYPSVHILPQCSRQRSLRCELLSVTSTSCRRRGLLQRRCFRGRGVPQDDVVMRLGHTRVAGVEHDVDVIHPLALPALEAGECFLSRSEERREGKSVDLGGRRIIKKKKNEERMRR